MRGGGVAITYNMNLISLKEHKIKGNTFEMIAASGKLADTNRYLCIFGIYVPPKMKSDTFVALNKCLIAAISDAKSKYVDPVVIIGGDMNRSNQGLS